MRRYVLTCFLLRKFSELPINNYMDTQTLIDAFFHDGKYCAGKWRNAKLYPEVDNLPGESLAEKVWNGLYTRPKCHCGKLTRWLNTTSGYRIYCSPTCAQLSPLLEFEKRHRQEKLWSNPDWATSTAQKMKETHFKNRTPHKLEVLWNSKQIKCLDELTPGQSNMYRWQHVCGEVFLKPISRIAAIYCPRCHVSKGQGELYELIRQNYPGKIIVNDRQAIAPKEIDIYIPELKLGFEFNGKYWHPGDGSRERFKTDEADALGIHIEHIWEIEWLQKKIKPQLEQKVLKLIS